MDENKKDQNQEINTTTQQNNKNRQKIIIQYAGTLILITIFLLLAKQLIKIIIHLAKIKIIISPLPAYKLLKLMP